MQRQVKHFAVVVFPDIGIRLVRPRRDVSHPNGNARLACAPDRTTDHARADGIGRRIQRHRRTAKPIAGDRRISSVFAFPRIAIKCERRAVEIECPEEAGGGRDRA